MASLEINLNPTYPTVTQQIAGMALEALRSPRAALEDLTRPSEHHYVSGHIRGTYTAILGSFGLKSGDL